MSEPPPPIPPSGKPRPRPKSRPRPRPKPSPNQRPKPRPQPNSGQKSRPRPIVKSDPDATPSAPTPSSRLKSPGPDAVISIPDESTSSILTPDAISSSSTPSIPQPPIEEEDEIVREIDVYISPQLSPTLHLLQFPLTPAHSTLLPAAARLRPHHKNLELTFPLSSQSKYASIRGNFSPGLVSGMTQRKFTSERITPSTHYGLGVLSTSGKKLYLVPLQTDVLQCRPSFDHVDRALGLLDEETDESEEKKRESISIKRLDKRVEPGVVRTRQTYASMKAEVESEEWLDLDVVNYGSAAWREKRSQVEVRSQDVGSLKLKMSKKCNSVRVANKEYVKTLNYMGMGFHDEDEEEEEKEKDQNGNPIPSEDGADKMEEDDPFAGEDTKKQKEEQSLKAIRDLTAKLTNFFLQSSGYPIPFIMLQKHFLQDENALSDSTSFNGILEGKKLFRSAITACAVSIRGSNFVLKSSLMTWIPSPLVRNVVRDLILILLNRDGIVYGERLMHLFVHQGNASSTSSPANKDSEEKDTAEKKDPVSEENVLDILEELCKKGENCWEMKFEDDDDGADVMEDVLGGGVLDMYTMYWARREGDLMEYLDRYDDFFLTSTDD